MKILIVKVSALGDVVHSLPVLAYLHSAVKSTDIEIDWLVEEENSTILAGHPQIHRVISLKTKLWRQLPKVQMLVEMFRFIKDLRTVRYDIVLDLQGNSKSGLFTLLCRGKDKYGFDRHQVRELPNLLATNHRIALTDADHHITQRSLAIARGAVAGGSDLRSAGPLPIDSKVQQRVVEQLQQLEIQHRGIQQGGIDRQKLLILNYGTTWSTKLWSLANWQELARQLVAQGVGQVLLTWGNKAEQQAAQSIAAATDGQALVWSRCSLPELVALLDRASVVVGCDTGPVHIAAAVGTPTVSMFRVTDATRNGPQGDIHRCLQTPLSCSPCLLKQCERDEECAESIAVADVYQAVTDLLHLK